MEKDTNSEPAYCPQCGFDFKGGLIPETDRHHFGNKTHFSTVIGIYDPNLDGTVQWMCPECQHRWDR